MHLLAEIKVEHEPVHQSVGVMTDGGAGIGLHQPHLMQHLTNPHDVGDSAGYGPALTETYRLARAREQSARSIKPAEVIHSAAV